jgi:hypothetical protein
VQDREGAMHDSAIQYRELCTTVQASTGQLRTCWTVQNNANATQDRAVLYSVQCRNNSGPCGSVKDRICGNQTSATVQSMAHSTSILNYPPNTELVVFKPRSSWRFKVFGSEYWIYYRGPGFFTVLWFGSSPPPSRQRAWPRWHTERLRKRDKLLTG